MGKVLHTYCIGGNPVSKKNSQRMVTNKKTGKTFPIPSAQYVAYENAASYFLQPRLEKPIDFPVNVRCAFYMQTRRKCDLVNMLQAVDDVLVKYKILEDDNFTIVEGHDGSRILYDKENPRTEIFIEEIEENNAETEDIFNSNV